MSWFRVDDAFGTHPKVLGIPRGRRRAAIGLWTLAGSWCARNLTDGAIPAYMIDELGGEDTEVGDLLLANLWEETESGFQVHDYLDYNPSREKVLAERAAAVERQRQARERAAARRKAEASQRESQRDADGTASRRDSRRESQRDITANGAGSGNADEQDGTLPLGVLSQRESHVTQALRHTQAERESQPPDPTRPDPTHKTKRQKPAAAAGAASGAGKDTPEGRIADAVYDRLQGMITWVAIRQIACRAMRVSGATEQRVADAMCSVYEAGKPVTLQTVGQLLSGSLNLNGSHPQSQIARNRTFIDDPNAKFGMPGSDV